MSLPTAASIILHQYDLSPFSEKIRVVLGIKRLEWYACDQPVILPKPELIALTGGYRRIPVMQIGADIYCDTQIIVRELERRFPVPSILVGGDHGMGYGVGLWTDRAMFQPAVTLIFGAGERVVEDAFIKDREALSGRAWDLAARRQAAPRVAEQLRSQFSWLDEQLSDGRRFLLGNQPGLADASAYYNIAWIRRVFTTGLAIIDRLPRLIAWEARVRAIGHGTKYEISRDAALDVARDATSTERPATDPEEPNGLKSGDMVSIVADDYGRDPVTGVLVSSSAHHVAIRRQDPRVGDVVVHFPRTGFFVIPTEKN
jgi:glutathione S-transferase